MRNSKFISLICLVLLLALGGMIALEVIALTRAKTESQKLQNSSPFSEQLFASFEEADDDVNFNALQITDTQHFIPGINYSGIVPYVITLFYILIIAVSYIETERHLKLRVLRI